MTVGKGYSRTHIALHWIIAVLIVWNYVISDGMGTALDARVGGNAVQGWQHLSHIWIGGAVLSLTLLRLVLRRTDGVPDPKEVGVTWLDVTALWTHRVLYLLLILVQTLGLIAWFARIPLAGDLHVYAMNALIILALIHATAALFHHFVLKDGLLWRMARPE